MMTDTRFATTVLGVDEKLSLSEAQTLFARGDLTEAAEACRAIYRDSPEDPGAVHLLGVVLAAAGQHEAARAWLERALALGGANASLLFDYGMTLRALGHMVEAARAFRLAADADGDDVEARFTLGTTRVALGDYAEGAAALQKAAEMAPDRAEIRENLGLALLALGDSDAAARAFSAALALDPNSLEARLQLGLIQQRRRMFEAAHTTFLAAVARAPENARAHAYLGNVLRDMGRFADSHAELAHARALAPDDAEVIGNEGLSWHHAGELERAIACYARAIELAPTSEPLHSSLAQALLLAGEFDKGWAEFENRFLDPPTAARVADLPGMRWRGGDIADRSLLLRCEQGLGDIIQFARYVPVLAGRGARITLVGPSRMERLMTGLSGLESYRPEDGPLPPVDLNAPLLSVPHLLGPMPIPAAVPYLATEPALVDVWNRRLGHDGRRRIGIAWQGNPDYAMDYLRSIPADRMAELIDGLDARFVILQYGAPPQTLIDAGAEYLGADPDREHAFLDTAAIMATLDLVITSDTALAHLAGALARPTWVLLPYAPDWRWRLGRADCDWYPTMRLFRQTSPGDWAGVVADVRTQLTG